VESRNPSVSLCCNPSANTAHRQPIRSPNKRTLRPKTFRQGRFPADSGYAPNYPDQSAGRRQLNAVIERCANTGHIQAVAVTALTWRIHRAPLAVRQQPERTAHGGRAAVNAALLNTFAPQRPSAQATWASRPAAAQQCAAALVMVNAPSLMPRVLPPIQVRKFRLQAAG
jgi:hypothetical protein